MKKLARILLIVLAISLLSPSSAYAAPKGYKEVKITKKNASKYFGFKKEKNKDESGKYSGYTFRTYNKYRKKGYYIYDAQNFSLKVSFKERYKFKDNNKKWKKYTYKDTRTVSRIDDSLIAYGKIFNYKYAKLLKTKIKKAKGTVTFIEPSNIVRIENGEYSNGEKYYRFVLKYPYDQRTSPYGGHYNEKGEFVTDYYSFDVSSYEMTYI